MNKNNILFEDFTSLCDAIETCENENDLRNIALNAEISDNDLILSPNELVDNIKDKFDSENDDNKRIAAFMCGLRCFDIEFNKKDVTSDLISNLIYDDITLFDDILPELIQNRDIYKISDGMVILLMLNADFD